MGARGPATIIGTTALIDSLNRSSAAYDLITRRAAPSLIRGGVVISAASVIQVKGYLASIEDYNLRSVQTQKFKMIIKAFRQFRCIVPIHLHYIDYAENNLNYAFSYVDDHGSEVAVGLVDKIVWATALLGVYAPRLLLIDYEIPSVHRFLVEHHNLSFHSLGSVLKPSGAQSRG